MDCTFWVKQDNRIALRVVRMSIRLIGIFVMFRRYALPPGHADVRFRSGAVVAGWWSRLLCGCRGKSRQLLARAAVRTPDEVLARAAAGRTAGHTGAAARIRQCVRSERGRRGDRWVCVWGLEADRSTCAGLTELTVWGLFCRHGRNCTACGSGSLRLRRADAQGGRTATAQHTEHHKCGVDAKNGIEQVVEVSECVFKQKERTGFTLRTLQLPGVQS